MSNNDRSFFDDEGPTQLDGGGGGGNQPYDDPDAPTRLPNYNRNVHDDPDDPTQLPKRANPDYYDDDEGHTLLGEQDQEIKPLGFLIVKRPLVRRGHVFTVKERVTIGREHGQVRLQTDRRVSARHANVRMVEDADSGEPVFIIVDLDSKTGTYINDNPERVDGRFRLSQGDEIRIGDHIFLFAMMKD